MLPWYALCDNKSVADNMMYGLHHGDRILCGDRTLQGGLGAHGENNKGEGGRLGTTNTSHTRKKRHTHIADAVLAKKQLAPRTLT